MKPCIGCGEPVAASRCDECQREIERTYPSTRPSTSATERGYDWRWTQLSRRARRTQPWCTDCGTEDSLTADHSPEAWRRYEAGLPIRLRDVDVVCHPCNVARGSSRPGGKGSPAPCPTPPGQAQTGLRMVLRPGEAS